MAHFRTRHTKIVCTLGPASRKPEVISEMIDAGMNVVRLNFSHSTHEDHGWAIKTVRELSEKKGVPVAIMADLQGPKIRLGALTGERDLINDSTIKLKVGADDDADLPDDTLPLPLPGVTNLLSVGSRIAINDGMVRLSVTGIDEGDDLITCMVNEGGIVSSHKGVNLPGVDLGLPALTEKDLEDAAFALEHEVDYIAQSFVSGPMDIEKLRSIIAQSGIHDKPQIIAKIEQKVAVDRLDDILAASDGVMVARGDLGVELGAAEVPLAQKRIIKRANDFAIPVITATQMLESMIHRPEPTRAEASDVANAVLDGTSAVMLSGETAMGEYPVHACATLDRIARVAEPAMELPSSYLGAHRAASIPEALSSSACEIAELLNAAAILVTTATGRTARQVSKSRPRRTILAASDSPRVCTRLALDWGTVPVLIRDPATTDEYWEQSIAAARDSGLVGVGDRIVMTAGTIVGMPGMTNMLKVEEFHE